MGSSLLAAEFGGEVKRLIVERSTGKVEPKSGDSSRERGQLEKGSDTNACEVPFGPLAAMGN
jgi:hypothetical protein